MAADVGTRSAAAVMRRCDAWRARARWCNAAAVSLASVVPGPLGRGTSGRSTTRWRQGAPVQPKRPFQTRPRRRSEAGALPNNPCPHRPNQTLQTRRRQTTSLLRPLIGRAALRRHKKSRCELTAAAARNCLLPSWVPSFLPSLAGLLLPRLPNEHMPDLFSCCPERGGGMHAGRQQQ